MLGRAMLMAASNSEAAAETDPFFSNVSLLLPATGANNSTTIADLSSSPKIITVFGDTKIITTVADPFGSSNGVITLDGNGDYFTTPVLSDYEFGTGSFTVECWYRFSAIQAYNVLACLGVGANAGGPFCGWALMHVLTGSQLYWYRYDGAETSFTAPFTPSVNTWYHIAACRSGSSLRLFVGGNQIGSTFTASASYNRVNSDPLRFGTATFGGNSYFSNGQHGPLRITKGVARYTANFTPPAAPFPTA